MLRNAVFLSAIGLLSLTLLPSLSQAQEQPFQLSFIGPTMQLVDDDVSIKGVRLNILYGVNENVTGLDFGLINRVRGDFKGVQAGFLGMVEGDFEGWQTSVFNVTEGDFLGLQDGLVNVMEVGEGVQWGGFYNSAQYLSGLQFALINYAEDMYGIQLGLINIIRSKEELPILPLVNWNFNERSHRQ